MNLKNHWNIIYCQRKYGGERKAISVNKLEKYIPAKRAEIIRKGLAKSTADKMVYSIQGLGKVICYSK